MGRLLSGVAVAALIVSAMVVASHADSPHKVTICHFDGHDGDFVTNNWITIGTPQCDEDGGNAIVVSPSGCEGHNAFARFGRNCDQGADQDGAPD